MSLIDYLLDTFEEPGQFELLCTQALLKEGYAHINPVGGRDDKGRDAEEQLYTASEGQRTILFQFSLQKTVSAKVRKTLKRLADTGLAANRVIFIFNTRLRNAGEREELKSYALEQYGLDIDICDQRYLSVRLGTAAYKDIVNSFFADTIRELQEDYDQGTAFTPSFVQSEQERRCLINLMHYARHPLAQDLRAATVQQAIRTILASAPAPLGHSELTRMVLDYLPTSGVADEGLVRQQLAALVSAGEAAEANGRYGLRDAEREAVEREIAEIIAGRRALLARIYEEYSQGQGASRNRESVSMAVDEFLRVLFQAHGTEVANALLDPDQKGSSLDTALEAENIDALLARVTGAWSPADAAAFRKAIKNTIRDPFGPGLGYLSALSRSYVSMQILNVDPQGINFQRMRLQDSAAILDTDVVLTGIVRGADRHGVSVAIASMCRRLGVKCFALDSSIEEIIFRIERSIHLYEDLGRPTFIPRDKKGLLHDIFLDMFFDRLIAGEVRSFEEYIAQYYRLSSPHEHIRELIDEKLGIPIEASTTHYLLDQEDKVARIQETIEESRTEALAFKNSKLYRNDALAMVIVEQQNREKLNNNGLGRWYLVSSDKHILHAYLKRKGSFRIKPSILPIFFLELLRQSPQSQAEENSFGAILESQAMLRGGGRNFAPVIAALTKLGVKALALPMDRLLEVIDEMDRADLTRWLVRLRGQAAVDDKTREEICEAIERMIAESASRSEQVERLKRVAAETQLEEE